ncbi:hypothetical protein [Sphingomonas sp. 8AM]|nr:hypothetical protein [Sphingomonas sp. 8AM]
MTVSLIDRLPSFRPDTTSNRFEMRVVIPAATDDSVRPELRAA